VTARPKVLMASLDYWSSPFRYGGHHLAVAFAGAGWDVAYLSWPMSPTALARGWTTALQDRLRIYRGGGITDADGHIWAYVPGALITPHDAPLLRQYWIHRNWPRLTVPSTMGLLRRHDFGSVDLLYVDHPVQRAWLDAVPHRRSVARIADRLSAIAHQAPAMLRMERELVSSVDLVAYTARSLEDHVLSLGARSMIHLPNGVDFEPFANGNRDVPADIAAIPRPIAIYVGAMDFWFDFRLVNEMAARLPEISFVLIGPEGLARKRLAPRPNIHIIGRRMYEVVPRYLHNADVGLIPFAARDHPDLVNGIHPLKLYEYFACGLPVVAASWDEIRRMRSPAILCETVDEYVRAVRSALEVPPDPTQGVEFARNADWMIRARTLLAHLDL
jgi:glycosyltransferase involved in cell wall biosynthesis